MNWIIAAITFFTLSTSFAAEKETPKRNPSGLQQDSPNQVTISGQRTTWLVTCPENIIAMMRKLQEQGYELDDKNDRNYPITNYSGTNITYVEYAKGAENTRLYIQPGAGCAWIDGFEFGTGVSRE
jgi:hypothetical protein